MHGVGHGLLFHASGVHRCQSPAIETDPSVLTTAVESCASAPYNAMRLSCAGGLFHGMVEYTRFAVNWDPPVKDRWWPCRVIILSAHCFSWIFSQGLILEPGKGYYLTHRYHEFMKLISSSDPCTRILMRSEANVRGCIWGISQVYFLSYHELWHAIKIGKKTACETVGLTENLFFSCRVASQFYHSRNRTGSNSAIVDWCSVFISPSSQHHLSVRDWQRWLVCLHGSIFLTSHAMSKLKLPSAYAFASCSHDLPWHSSSLWRGVESYCLTQWQERYEISHRTGRYASSLYIPVFHPFTIDIVEEDLTKGI